ncbi:MAG TPA: efflux RND transporter periplasmic adaptor subunit [Victivallales bacterium]|nr:efflux RND transporter periplasmic adaptor subunit [Victivallales bacterium]
MILKNFFYKKNMITLLSSLTIAIFISGCSTQTINPPPPPKVVVSSVISKKVNLYKEMVGEVIAKKKANLRARITGFIEKQNFPNGSTVKKGDVIFLIQQNQYKAQLEAAEANLLKAQAELNNTDIDYNRKKFLVKKSAVSVVDFDLAATAKATAESALLTAKANLELAKLDLSYTKVKAPYNGVIGIANYDPGNLVNLTSKPLITLVKTDPILVQFNISESLFEDILQYHHKNKTKDKKNTSYPEIIVKLILSNGTEYQYNGRITFVDNQINSMTGTISMRAQFKNPQQFLTPGGYVKVKLMKNNPKNALLIPQASIQESQAGSYVFTVNSKNRVDQKFIKTGAVYGTDIIVTKGLKVGEHVICQGLQKVREGIKVHPVTAANTPTEDLNTKPNISQIKKNSKSKEKIQNTTDNQFNKTIQDKNKSIKSTHSNLDVQTQGQVK